MANYLRQDFLTPAAYDFYFLLTRKYPRDLSLEIVGNRYGLTKKEREVLKRGIHPQKEALTRRGKQFKTASWSNRTITIDGHNVHITLESIFLDKILVLANDGPLRDISGVSGSFRATEITVYVIETLYKFFKEYPPKRLVILFDSPISKSGELAKLYRQTLSKLSIPIKSQAVPVPEKVFDYESTIVASSDSHVIDLSRIWLDLPRLIVDHFDIRIKSYDFSYLTFSPFAVSQRNDD